MAKLQERFDQILGEAFDLRLAEQLGETLESPALAWWRGMKADIDAEFGTEPLNGLRWAKDPVYPKTELDDDYFEDGSVNQHFLNQLVRIPKEEPAPTARKLLQLALNTGQGLAQGTIAHQWR